MPIIGHTEDGYRIARRSDGARVVLDHGQESIEFFYNGPAIREVERP